MTWTDFWTGIGNFFTTTFKLMEPIGNSLNYPLWVLIFCLLVFWISQIIKQNKEADRNGTLR